MSFARSCARSFRARPPWTKSMAPWVMWLPTKFDVRPTWGFSYPMSGLALTEPSGFSSRAS